jgi:hypothetical protein
MEQKTKKRFSFSQTAAQQPARQRFSFSQPKQKSLPEVLTEKLPATAMIREISKNSTTPKFSFSKAAKEFLVPGRGFTDEQINEVEVKDLSLKDIAAGATKWTGELGLGLISAAHLGGTQLAKLLPGYDAKGADEARDRFNSASNKLTTPTTPEQAKVMRTLDIGTVGTAAVGRISKVSKLDTISDIAKNSLKNETGGVRNASLDFLRKNPEEITKGEVRLREVEGGKVVIEDGRHRLEVGRELGITPKIIDVTAEYTGKPSSKIASLIKGDAPTPKPVVDSIKERGFVTSVKEVVPEASKVAGQYVVRNTDELAIKARNEVVNNPTRAEAYIKNYTDDKSVAMASEYIKKISADASRATDDLIKNALYDKVADLTNDMAARLTEQGRSIQAASILGRLTPEGQIRFAAKEIQRFNRANPSKRIPELSGQDAKFIGDEMKAITQMPEGLDRAMRFKKLQDYVQDLVPTPLWKKVATVWKAGLLTGLKTSGLNIFSNLSHFASEIAKDAPAVIVDKAASLFTGKRTMALTMRGAFDGMKEGSIKGKRYFFSGFDERNLGEKLDYTRVNFGKGPVAKAFKAYTETVFRVIGAQDQPFYYATLSRSLMDQALAQGINKGLKGKKLIDNAYQIVENPSEEMVRYATSDAATAVFMNRTKLGEAASTIQKIPYVGEFFIPFARTPSSVAMQVVSYSPLGFVKAAVDAVKGGAFDQRIFSQGTGRAVIGTAVMAIGYKLAEEGLISESFPVGDEREQELQRAEGRKTNAIKVGDEWRSPLVLGPLGNLLLVGAEFQRAIKENGSPTEAISKAMSASVKAFTEQTFLTGLSDAINAITDPKRYASQYLPNLVASFIPTLVSDVARATDDKERRPDTTLDRVKARIPGARQTVEPQVDILGREQARVGNPLEVLIDPTRPTPEVGTIVTEELRRLAISGFNVSPTKLGDRQGYEALTPEENTKLWKFTGQIVNQKLSSLFTNEQYQKAPEDQKAKAVENIIEKSKDYSRAAMVVELTDGLQGEELKTKLAELKAGGVLTRDVFRMYGEIR